MGSAFSRALRLAPDSTVGGFFCLSAFTPLCLSASIPLRRLPMNVVDDPNTWFAQAIKAGATEIFPVGEGHGWRLGRLSNPFGLHWEIGHQLV